MDRNTILEKLHQINERDTFFYENGMRVLDAGEGSAGSGMKVEPKPLSPLGVVHGGCLFAIADSTSGGAANTLGSCGPTISGDVYFLRPVAGAKEITCQARVVKRGRHIVVVDCSIKDDREREVFKATLQYMVLEEADPSASPFKRLTEFDNV